MVRVPQCSVSSLFLSNWTNKSQDAVIKVVGETPKSSESKHLILAGSPALRHMLLCALATVAETQELDVKLLDRQNVVSDFDTHSVFVKKATIKNFKDCLSNLLESNIASLPASIVFARVVDRISCASLDEAHFQNLQLQGDAMLARIAIIARRLLATPTILTSCVIVIVTRCSDRASDATQQAEIARQREKVEATPRKSFSSIKNIMYVHHDASAIAGYDHTGKHVIYHQAIHDRFRRAHITFSKWSGR